MAAPRGSIRLDGKVAVVTGASRGIGRAIALDLAARGCSVAVNYVASAAAAQAVVAEIQQLGQRSIAIQADTASHTDIVRLFHDAVAALGPPDIVVSNAGIECFASLEETSPELWDRVFNVNTRGQFFVAVEGYKHIQRRGRIVLMSSIAASLKSLKGHALYAASKAGVEALVRSLPADFADKQVTVNAVAPGGIASDMARENAWKYVPGGSAEVDPQVMFQQLADINPLKRFGQPDDVAKVVAFLASEDSEWINGQTITLSGGSKT